MFKLGMGCESETDQVTSPLHLQAVRLLRRSDNPENEHSVGLW